MDPRAREREVRTRPVKVGDIRKIQGYRIGVPGFSVLLSVLDRILGRRWETTTRPGGQPKPRFWPAPNAAGELVLKLLDSWSVQRSQRLYVGANDVAHGADFREVIDFAYGRLLLAKAVLHGFKSNVQSDLIAKLEAVGHGFCSGVNTDGYPSTR
jgi:hypothetical protein